MKRSLGFWLLVSEAKQLVALLLYYLRATPDLLQLLLDGRRSDHCDESESTGIQSVWLYSAFPRVRETKIAAALAQVGINVALLTERSLPTNHPVLQHCQEVIRVRNILQGIAKARSARVKILHVFANGDQTRLLPLAFIRDPCWIFDPYDVLRGTYIVHNRMAINAWLSFRAERQLVENANLVCCRSLEVQILKRKFAYRPKRTIYFPDYCWSAPRIRTNGCQAKVRIVYVGGVWPEDRYPFEQFGHAQFLSLAQALSEHKIHFHIYPAYPPGKNLDRDAEFRDFYQVYIRAEERNSYLHLHREVSHRDMIDRLSEYDFGFFHQGLIAKDPINTEDKYRYGAANKIFDYIEAGLPIILHDSFHQKAVARHYGEVLVVSSVPELASKLHGTAAVHTPKDGRQATIGFQIPRLVRAYEILLVHRNVLSRPVSSQD